MIVKTNCEANGSSAALVVTPGAGVEVLILRRGGRISNLRIYWDNIINANISECNVINVSLNIVFREIFLAPLRGRCSGVSCIRVSRLLCPRQSRSGPGGGKLAAARTRRAGPSFNVGQRRPAIAGIRGTMEYRASDPNWHWEVCSKMVTHTDTPCNFCKFFSLRKYKLRLLLS